MPGSKDCSRLSLSKMRSCPCYKNKINWNTWLLLQHHQCWAILIIIDNHFLKQKQPFTLTFGFFSEVGGFGCSELALRRVWGQEIGSYFYSIIERLFLWTVQSYKHTRLSHFDIETCSWSAVTASGFSENFLLSLYCSLGESSNFT